MSEAQATTAREPFVVDNDMKAEWCLNKIRKARNEQKRERNEIERQMTFYRERLEEIDNEADNEVEFFKSMLRPYFENRVDNNFAKATKTRVSYTLPTGKLILKHMEPVFKRDDKAVIEWLRKEHAGDHIKVKEELDWAGLKKDAKVLGNRCIVPSTGEIIPGIEVYEREDEFEVEA